MTIPESSGAPVSRAKEFFQGFFLPLLFALPGLASYPLWVVYDQRRGISNAGDESIPTAALFALLGSMVLVLRWWRRARWRAYGILAGLFGAPPLLGALFVAAILLFKVNLFPR